MCRERGAGAASHIVAIYIFEGRGERRDNRARLLFLYHSQPPRRRAGRGRREARAARAGAAEAAEAPPLLTVAGRPLYHMGRPQALFSVCATPPTAAGRSGRCDRARRAPPARNCALPSELAVPGAWCGDENARERETAQLSCTPTLPIPFAASPRATSSPARWPRWSRSSPRPAAGAPRACPAGRGPARRASPPRPGSRRAPPR